MKYGLKEQSKGKAEGSRKLGNNIRKSTLILCRAPPYASSRVLARVNIGENVRSTTKERGEKGKLISFMMQIESSNNLPSLTDLQQ